MAVNKNSKKSDYASYKGAPSNTGHSKAEVKEMQKSKSDLQEEEEINKKYVDEEGQPVDHLLKNKNRNTDKVDIDKGKYN